MFVRCDSRSNDRHDQPDYYKCHSVSVQRFLTQRSIRLRCNPVILKSSPAFETASSQIPYFATRLNILPARPEGKGYVDSEVHRRSVFRRKAASHDRPRKKPDKQG
jgi:hypothetical protein